MNKKIPSSVALGIIITAAIFFGGFMWANNRGSEQMNPYDYANNFSQKRITPKPPEEKEGVTITTDKPEYEKGEPVKISALNNKSTPIYIYFSFENINLQEFENGAWKNISQSCSNACGCENNVVSCISLTPPQFFYTKFEGSDEYSWNQTKCNPVKKTCGKEEYSVGELIGVGSGRFKASFCFWDEKDVDMSSPPYNAPKEKEQCVSTEFLIK